MRILRAGLAILFDSKDFEEFVELSSNAVINSKPTHYPVLVSYGQIVSLQSGKNGKAFVGCHYIYRAELYNAYLIMDEYVRGDEE